MKKILLNAATLLILIFIGFALYASTLRGVKGNPRVGDFKNNLDQATKPFELSPERGRYLLLMSLGDNRSFALTTEMAKAGYPDIGYYGDKYYVYFAPGISLLSLPLYTIGKSIGFAQTSAFITIAVFALLNLIFIYWIGSKILRLSRSYSFLAAILFGFATTSWSYAITLYQHHVTLFFILSSFLSAWKYRNTSKHSWLFSAYVWFAYGAALFLDYPNAILLAPIMIYHLSGAIRLKKLAAVVQVRFRLSYIITSIVCISLVALHGYYNFVHFGSPLRLSGSLSSVIQKTDRQTSNTTHSLNLQKVEKTKSISNFFQEEQFPRGLSILLGSRDRGLFFYSPVLFVGVLGVISALHMLALESAFLLGIMAINILLYASWGDPWGGWAYGPRYLIPTMAILSIFAARYIAKVRSQATQLGVKIITLLLFGYSSAVALLGALTTNAVPPKIEADFLKMNYNFMHNLIFLRNNQSGSFVYNTFFSQHTTLQQYAMIIWCALMLILFVVLFIGPLFEKNHES